MLKGYTHLVALPWFIQPKLRAPHIFWGPWLWSDCFGGIWNLCLGPGCSLPSILSLTAMTLTLSTSLLWQGPSLKVFCRYASEKVLILNHGWSEPASSRWQTCALQTRRRQRWRGALALAGLLAWALWRCPFWVILQLLIQAQFHFSKLFYKQLMCVQKWFTILKIGHANPKIHIRKLWESIQIIFEQSRKHLFLRPGCHVMKKVSFARVDEDFLSPWAPIIIGLLLRGSQNIRSWWYLMSLNVSARGEHSTGWTPALAHVWQLSFLMVVTLSLNFPLGKVRIEWMPENLFLQVKTNSFVFPATRRRVLGVTANDITDISEEVDELGLWA